jgi:hypothetical protein
MSAFLPEFRETEIKRINEENLQSLRKMERKYMNEEKEHEKTKEEVAALKVSYDPVSVPGGHREYISGILGLTA